jgi:hypothetical protein
VEGKGREMARAEQVFVGTVTFGRSNPRAEAGYFNFRLLVF